MDDKKRELKKFFHDYAVAIAATILLILLLAVLLMARSGALSSLKDLSKLNPLITSGRNELVAAKDSSGVVKIPKDDNTSDSKQDTATSSQGTGQGIVSTQNNNPASNGDVSTGSGTNGGPAPSVAPFGASIAQVRHFASTGTSVLGTCQVNHQFQADINGTNAPGTVSYRWKRSDGTIEPAQQVNFQAGDSMKTVSYSWTINSSSGNYSVTFELLSPTKVEQKLSFQHSCSVVGL